jgi:hypothetical protein
MTRMGYKPDFPWWDQQARFVLWHGDKAMLARVMSFIAVGGPVSVLAVSEINEGVLSEIQGMQEAMSREGDLLLAAEMRANWRDVERVIARNLHSWPSSPPLPLVRWTGATHLGDGDGGTR